MHLSGRLRSLRRTQKSSQAIQDTFEKIRLSLNLSSQNWCDMIQLTSAEYRKVRQGVLDIPATSLSYLAQALCLNVETLISGQIDYSTPAAHFRGQIDFIPEQYTIGAFSKMRTVANTLNYLESMGEWRMGVHMLQQFQIHRSALASPETRINICLVSDLFQYLSRIGFSEEDLVNMGASSVIGNSKTLGALVSDLKTPAQVYERLFNEYQSFFEQNCDYRFKILDQTGCVVSHQWKQDLMDSLRTNMIGNVKTCFAKMGIMQSVPGFLGLPNAKVKKIACVYSGDASCMYHIDFSEAHLAAQADSSVNI